MLIYLNGTSSSGKTSIAIELQKLIKKPVFYFSIDTLLYSLAEEDLRAIMGLQPARKELDWNAIFRGYFASVRALLDAGNFVIADAPIYNQNLLALFSDLLGSFPTKLVIQLDCSLVELERRERMRGDRALGIAKKQFGGIREFLKFDLSIHSEQQSPHISALQIFDSLHM